MLDFWRSKYLILDVAGYLDVDVLLDKDNDDNDAKLLCKVV